MSIRRLPNDLSPMQEGQEREESVFKKAMFVPKAGAAGLA